MEKSINDLLNVFYWIVSLFNNSFRDFGYVLFDVRTILNVNQMFLNNI